MYVVLEDRKLNLKEIREQVVVGARRNGVVLYANFAGGSSRDIFAFHGLKLPDELGFYFLDAKSYVEPWTELAR